MDTEKKYVYIEDSGAVTWAPLINEIPTELFYRGKTLTHEEFVNIILTQATQSNYTATALQTFFTNLKTIIKNNFTNQFKLVASYTKHFDESTWSPWENDLYSFTIPVSEHKVVAPGEPEAPSHIDTEMFIVDAQGAKEVFQVAISEDGTVRCYTDNPESVGYVIVRNAGRAYNYAAIDIPATDIVGLKEAVLSYTKDPLDALENSFETEINKIVSTSTTPWPTNVSLQPGSKNVTAYSQFAWKDAEGKAIHSTYAKLEDHTALENAFNMIVTEEAVDASEQTCTGVVYAYTDINGSVIHKTYAKEADMQGLKDSYDIINGKYNKVVKLANDLDEQVQDLDQQVKDFDESFTELTKTVNNNKAELDKKIEALQKTAEEHSGYISDLQTDVGDINDAIGTTTYNGDSLTAAIAALQTDVDNIETSIGATDYIGDSLTAAIATLQTEVAAFDEAAEKKHNELLEKIQANTEAIAKESGAYDDEIAALNTAVTNITNITIPGIEEDIKTINGKIGNANIGDDTTLTAAINALQSQIGGTALQGSILQNIDALRTAVGDSSKGLVKDVSDLQSTVNNTSTGLVSQVNGLQGKVTALENLLNGTDTEGGVDVGDNIVTQITTLQETVSIIDGTTIPAVKKDVKALQDQYAAIALKAKNAEEYAGQALAKAGEAVTAANDAKENVSGAVKNAADALKTAGSANTTADNANKAAQEAQKAATQAEKDAAQAKSDAAKATALLDTVNILNARVGKGITGKSLTDVINALQEAHNALDTAVTVDLNTKVAALQTTVGDSNGGLVQALNTLDNNYNALNTAVTGTDGIISTVNTLKDQIGNVNTKDTVLYNIKSLQTDVSGINNKIGSSSLGSGVTVTSAIVGLRSTVSNNATFITNLNKQINNDTDGLVKSMATAVTNINTLSGYFTNGVANNATNANTIKVSGASYNGYYEIVISNSAPTNAASNVITFVLE